MKNTITNYRLGELVRTLGFAVRNIKDVSLNHPRAIAHCLEEIEKEMEKDSRFMGKDFTKQWPALKAKAKKVLNEASQ